MKAAREKQYIPWKRIAIGVTIIFSLEIVEVRRQWNIFKY